MYIYQDISGKGLTRSEWQKKSHSKEWTVKSYQNDKISIAVHWIGRYEKRLPSEFRNSFGVLVKNRMIMRKSEWDAEEVTTDEGWTLDPSATRTFRSLSLAEAYYEELLLTYTASYLEEDDSGELSMVEEGNQLKPKVAADFEVDEEQVEMAASKGIVIGGWS